VPVIGRLPGALPGIFAWYQGCELMYITKYMLEVGITPGAPPGKAARRCLQGDVTRLPGTKKPGVLVLV